MAASGKDDQAAGNAAGVAYKQNSQEIAAAHGLKLPEHLYGYQQSDWEVVDYRQYRFQKTPAFFRGPSYEKVLASRGNKKIVAFLGAAQFFGRFCDKSVPDLVTSDSIGALNFGAGGASPHFFLKLGEPFFDVLSRCDLVVLQVLSARAAPNSWLTALNPFRPNMITIRQTNEEMFVNQAWDRLLGTLTAREFGQAVEQTRLNYLRQMSELIQKIPARTAVMWYSDREPRYMPTYDHVSKAMGLFPQFVHEGMVDELRSKADGFAECVSSAGRPHRLVNRFTGAPAVIYPTRKDPSENYYYPTPGMNNAAANVLRKLFDQLL